MHVRRLSRLIVVCLLALCGLASRASAQSATSGSIGGGVTDSSGAVLPGVTVEAASPALIEKIRSVVTDGQGRYTIVDLRPGLYSVTFTLPGFNAFKREGIELTSGFSARVDAEMRVGALEETVTVTGASPVVDTQNVAARTVITRQVLDALPVSQNFASLGALTLGVTSPRDVGGSAGDRAGTMSIAGGRTDGIATFDGLNDHSLLNTGARRIHPNQLAIAEMTVQTRGMGAEAETGGVAVNIVPKDGGNTFAGVFNTGYTGKGLQNNNFTKSLELRGLTRAATPKYTYDLGVGFGGPIKKDKLWFYTAPSSRGSQSELAGVYYNKLQHSLFYQPDLDKPAFTDFPVHEATNVRLTWQASQKQKVTFTGIDQHSPNFYNGQGSTRTPEAAMNGDFKQRLIQGSWNDAVSNRMLLEATAMWRSDSGINPKTPGVTDKDRAVMDQGLGLWYGAHVNGSNPGLYSNSNGFLADDGIQTGHYVVTRLALNYVTGSHAFKTGFTTQTGHQSYGPGNGPSFEEAYRFRNQIPNGLWQIAGPGYAVSAFKMNMGIFAQDQWTLARKLTLNLAMRIDYINVYVPEQTRPAGLYIPEFHVTKIEHLPDWTDYSPRVGAAYDVFGNGKTAIKVSVGKYMSPVGLNIAQQTNPSEALAGTVFRTWNDTMFGPGDPRSGNFVPDCDLQNPQINGECGAFDNLNFGKPIVTTHYDPSYLTGSGKRGYNWQESVSLQHELMPKVALTANYYRTSFGNQTVIDNLKVTPSDYTEYCVTAPTDSRLPGGGGNKICGLYDLNPGKLGQVDNQYTLAKNFGKASEVYNGGDLGVNARAGKWTLFGGWSGGKTVVNTCGLIVDSPQPAVTDVTSSTTTRFCKNSNPTSQIKLAGVYPLPWWGLQASAVFQNLPGINNLANYVATNAQVLPTLNRNLGACGTAATCNSTVTVALIEPNTVREDRQNQLDFRVGANVRMGRYIFRPSLDIFNALNANDIQGLNATFGTSWLFASGILPARTFKFGLRIEF